MKRLWFRGFSFSGPLTHMTPSSRTLAPYTLIPTYTLSPSLLKDYVEDNGT